MGPQPSNSESIKRKNDPALNNSPLVSQPSMGDQVKFNIEMKYKFWKFTAITGFVLIVAMEVFVCVEQLSFTWSDGMSRGNSGLLSSAVAVILTALLILWFVLRRISALQTRQYVFETMTYDWYRNTYPKSMKGNRISCHHCGSTRVSTNRVMNQTYMRQHFCPQCGTTLYFSPEVG